MKWTGNYFFKGCLLSEPAALLIVLTLSRIKKSLASPCNYAICYGIALFLSEPRAIPMDIGMDTRIKAPIYWASLRFPTEF